METGKQALNRRHKSTFHTCAVEKARELLDEVPFHMGFRAYSLHTPYVRLCRSSLWNYDTDELQFTGDLTATSHPTLT